MKKINHEKLIFDNAPFSNFARIEKLELIFYISQNIYTTKEVIEEINNGISRNPTLAKRLQSIIGYADKGKIKVKTLKHFESVILMDTIIKEKILGKGEISAMTLAKELDGIFITDDKRATKRAERENIKTLNAGELGIKISNENQFKDTVIFLEILRKQKIISQSDFNEIKKSLKSENFIF